MVPIQPHPAPTPACAQPFGQRTCALRVSSGRIVDILNEKRASSAETALRLGRYFGNYQA
jgi:hypothetical protein